MKLSSWIALGSLVGTKIAGGEPDWKDAICSAIIAKNELLEKDGDLRRFLEGRDENEIAELKYELNRQLSKQEREAGSLEPTIRKRGIFAEFKRGFAEGWK